MLAIDKSDRLITQFVGQILIDLDTILVAKQFCAIPVPLLFDLRKVIQCQVLGEIVMSSGQEAKELIKTADEWSQRRVRTLNAICRSPYWCSPTDLRTSAKSLFFQRKARMSVAGIDGRIHAKIQNDPGNDPSSAPPGWARTPNRSHSRW